jgi:hypothetical protein
MGLAGDVILEYSTFADAQTCALQIQYSACTSWRLPPHPFVLLPQVESLYRAARDELARLDKENGELKDMLNTGVDTLTRSR